MQPYFFPYIGYFQLINAVDTFVILDDVNFIMGGWINRNRILINKKSSFLTIPVIKASQNKNINEINIAEYESWRTKMLTSITLAYKKAPYFDTVLPLIESVINYNIINLSSFIAASIESVCRFLDIDTEIIGSSIAYKNSRLTGQERILDICLQENVSTYINAINGVDLYEPSLFNASGVELQFIKSKLNKYPQFGNEFIPSLSIIDVLMFNSIDRIKVNLNEYSLIE